MSGDSPQCHRNDLSVIFVDGCGGPPLAATTSKEVAVQSISGVSGGNVCFVQAAVPVEKDKDNDEEDKAICSSVLEDASCEDSRNSDPDKTIPVAELSNAGKKKKGKEKEKKHKFQICQKGGKSKTKKPATSEECTVACLYYTIQCCECNIM